MKSRPRKFTVAELSSRTDWIPNYTTTSQIAQHAAIEVLKHPDDQALLAKLDDAIFAMIAAVPTNEPMQHLDRPRLIGERFHDPQCDVTYTVWSLVAESGARRMTAALSAPIHRIMTRLTEMDNSPLYYPLLDKKIILEVRVDELTSEESESVRDAGLLDVMMRLSATSDRHDRQVFENMIWHYAAAQVTPVPSSG